MDNVRESASGVCGCSLAESCSPNELFSQQTVLAELLQSESAFLNLHRDLRRYSPSVAAANPDSSDGRASDPNGGGHVLDDNSESREESRSSDAVSGLDGLAALDCTSGAGSRRVGLASVRGGVGGRKDSEGGESEDVGEHGEC